MMYKDNDYVYEALASLEEVSRLNIEFNSLREGYDGMVNIEDEQFYLFARKDARLTHANYIVNEILNHSKYSNTKNYLVIGDFIAAESKELFKSNKINYLDTAGNACIYSKKIKILVEGKRKVSNNRTTPRIFQEAGIKLLFILLTDKKSINYSLRELATKAGIALGSVSNIMKELQEENFIIKSARERKLKNRNELLQKWVEAYNEVLKPKLFRKSYRINNVNDLNQLNSTLNYQIGGELAAAKITGYLIPKDIEVYYEGELLEFAKEFKLIPDVNGNLKVYERFWNFDENNDRKRLASKLIIYADLFGSNNDRNRETAQMILENGI